MLNTISDDCIMEIFSYLGEHDLYEMQCVSCQMLYFGQLQAEKFGRNRMLRIVENESGHAFVLFNKYNPLSLSLKYGFTISDSSYYGHPHGKRFTINGDVNEEFEKMLLFEKYYLTKYGRVPSLLLSRLNELLQRHSFNHLALKNIKIDSDFMDYLEETVQEIDGFGLVGIKIDNDCMERFYQFVSKLRLSIFMIRQSALALQAFNNANFVEKFFRETKCAKGGYFFIDSPPYLTLKYRFHPSKISAIEYLSRSWVIDDRSLTIDPQWIPEIVEKRMKNWSDNLFEIIVGLSEMPKVWNFSAYNHLMLQPYDGAPFNQSRHAPSHVVIDTQTGRKIYFKTFTDDVLGIHVFSR